MSTNSNLNDVFLLYEFQLVEGLVEGKELNDSDLFGGLGQARIKQVVEERSIEGKCGNITCRKPCQGNFANYKDFGKDYIVAKSGSAKNIVVFTKVKAEIYDQYCGNDCYNKFETIINNLPKADVLDVQERINNKHATDPECEPLETLGNVGITKAIKERDVVSRPQKQFAISKSQALERFEKKKISFLEEQNNQSLSDFVDDADIADDDDDDEGDKDDDAENQEQQEKKRLDGIQTFWEKTNVNKNIEEIPGLSTFAIAQEMLSRWCTPLTAETIRSLASNVWEPPVGLNEEEVEERQQDMLAHLAVGVDSCNFAQEPDFSKHALLLIGQVVSTLDLSRPIPPLGKHYWDLLTCVLLSCFAETGHFEHIDFDKNNISMGLPEASSRMDTNQMNILKKICL